MRSKRDEAFEGYQDEEALDDEEIVLPLLSSEREVTLLSDEKANVSGAFANDINTETPIGDNGDRRRRVRKGNALTIDGEYSTLR